MRKVVVTLCPQDIPSFLTNGIYTELYHAPIYEHAFVKIENAVKALGMECEVVRASTCNVPNTVDSFNCDLEDIVVFASPFVFLAKNADVEGAINYITKTDLGYSTVGTDRSLYMTVGIKKMIAKTTVNTPYAFVTAITDGGARCPHANFADNEPAMPRGIIDYHQKSEAYRLEYLEYLIRFGVCIEALDGIIVSPLATVEPGAKIYTGSHIYGKSVIGKDAVIGPCTTIKNSTVGEGTIVKSSRVEDSVIEKDVSIDDYCVIRENCHFISDVKIASHCEIVNSLLLNACTVSSHSHIWDSEIGAHSIIGSHVTTINYEVNRKQSRCKIGDDTIVGCGANLVLPIEIGARAFVAAGSTITDDVQTGALGIAREYQKNISNWATRRKNHGKHF
ncbi:MAG: hypothetical protein IJ039_08390 [Clostridia bacterium]|nr:hypothetical protein [Clostridia bacterium]